MPPRGRGRPGSPCRPLPQPVRGLWPRLCGHSQASSQPAGKRGSSARSLDPSGVGMLSPASAWPGPAHANQARGGVQELLEKSLGSRPSAPGFRAWPRRRGGRGRRLPFLSAGVQMSLRLSQAAVGMANRVQRSPLLPPDQGMTHPCEDGLAKRQNFPVPAAHAETSQDPEAQRTFWRRASPDPWAHPHLQGTAPSPGPGPGTGFPRGADRTSSQLSSDTPALLHGLPQVSPERGRIQT